MSKNLTIVSVKCIKPSLAEDSTTQDVFGAIDAAIAGTATFVAGATTGGLLIAATGVAAAGVAVINGLDHCFAGSDDLYLKVNGDKVWPSERYKHRSQQTKDVGYSVPLGDNVTIQLWDYDSSSADDLLGYLTLGSDHQTGNFTYLVQDKAEESIYAINIRITE